MCPLILVLEKTLNSLQDNEKIVFLVYRNYIFFT